HRRSKSPAFSGVAAPARPPETTRSEWQHQGRTNPIPERSYPLPPRFQNGPAASEVPRLLFVVLGAAQIDEVEIDVVDAGAAQIDAAQVRLANLLGRLEMLLVTVVGVKAGACAFRGEGREEETTARRPHVESGAAQVGAAQTGTLQVDVAQFGVLQVGVGQISARHLGTRQQSVLQAGNTEIEA